MATVGPYNAATAEDKNEPTRPLAHPSPSVYPATNDDDIEAEGTAAAATTNRWRSMQYLRKRRCVLCCCGCCVTSVVVAGIVVLVLALTVFRVKDPRITMNGVSLTAVRTGSGGAGITAVAVNATLTADVSIKNPNAASFRFSRSETEVYLRGQTVSVAYVPGGRVGADRTVRMNVTLDLLGDRLAGVLDGAGLVLGQEYELTTYTEINGTVKLLGIYKKDLEIRMNCSINVAVGGVLVSGATSGGVQTKGLSCLANVS